MSRTIFQILILSAIPSLALAQSESWIDTLEIVSVDTFQVNSQPKELFVLAVATNGGYLIGEDSGYVKMFGWALPGDTGLFPEPITWVPASSPFIGDFWDGVLPALDDFYTYEEILAFDNITVPGGTYPGMRVGLWDLGDVYLGEKWYSDGIGLLGWNANICNEHYTLGLLTYTVVGGSGYWPMAVGNRWIYQTAWAITDRDTAATATITVDGLPGDWGAATPVVSDLSGDDSSPYTGCDIRGLYVAVSGSYLSFMLEFWDGAPDTTWGLQSLLAYRFDVEDWDGNLYTIGVYYDDVFTHDWAIVGSNIVLHSPLVAVNQVVEFGIPLSDFGSATELPYLTAQIGPNPYEYDYTCYITVDVPQACPLTVLGDVNGSGEVNATDIVYVVNYVLKAGPVPLPCEAAADVNCSGGVNLTDVTYLVNMVFKAGPPPCDICSLIPGTWTCP